MHNFTLIPTKMKNTLIDNLKIAVIGGGPVGLTTARLLQKNGANITVYERDKSPKSRITGRTLDIHKASGQLALEKAGILETYFQNARPTHESE